RLVAVHIPTAGRRLLEVVGDGEPVEALRVGELPQLAHLAERPAHGADVDPEVHVRLLPGLRAPGTRAWRARARGDRPSPGTAPRSPAAGRRAAPRPARRAARRPRRAADGPCGPRGLALVNRSGRACQVKHR